MSHSGDTFLEMRAIKQAQIDSLDNLFTCADKKEKIVKPIINILCRTYRPEYFKVCLESIKAQTYHNYALIVGSDTDCPYYPLAEKLFKNYQKPDYIPEGHYYAPYNLYLNQLQKSCVTGWVLALDEDDAFRNEYSLQKIVDNIDNEDQLLIWKVQILPNWEVPSYSFGKAITATDISGIGFLYHTKYNPVDWGCLSQGDYKVAKQLEAKGLKIKWINKVLTRTQKGPHGNNYGK